MGLLDRVNASQAEGQAPSASPSEPASALTGRLASLTQAPAPLADRIGAASEKEADPSADNLPRRTQRGTLNPLQITIKAAVHRLMLDNHADELSADKVDNIRIVASQTLEDYLRSQGTALPSADKFNLLEALMADIIGFGPLEILLNDPDVSEIMVNSAQLTFVERKGVISESNVHFETNEKLLQVIDRIVSRIGRHVDESNPLCDARLPDGSRVNVIIPPLALNGPCITIRKFSRQALQISDLVRFGSASPEMIAFMEACVKSRLNVLVSGGTGSGKTTLLNILSGFIPTTERIVTVEDAAELQLQQKHVIRLESRPSNVEGKGAVTIRDLVKNALRMRPDRIIVGECRSGEALDMLQAMNTGHDGSMSTLHANSPREAMSRLETLVLMAGADLPSRAIREQMASAVHIIVQQQRLRGGSRRITSISEVLGYDPTEGVIMLQEIFTFKALGVSDEGKTIGYHTATGTLPNNMAHFDEEGQHLENSLFVPAKLAAY
jgi:pilus assembly protein CpaF